MRTILLVFVALCLAVVPASAQPENPLAVLMALQGDVSVVRAGGGTVPANFGMHLHAGDEVSTAEDSSADILFSSGNSIHLGAGSKMAMQGSAAAPANSEDAPRFGSVQRYLKLKDSRGTSSLAGLRSGGEAPELMLLSPCQTRVRDAVPTFSWEGRPEVGELKLTVYHDSGIHWEGTVDGASSLAYPSEAPALSPEVRYSWTLETTDPLQFPPLRSPASFFEVLGNDQRDRLKEELASTETGDLSPVSRHLMKASILYEFGLLEEAINTTQAALDDDGGDVQMRSILARLYAEAGRASEAMREYDQLIEPR